MGQAVVLRAQIGNYVVVGEVIVVTGPPGAGKSVVAEKLADLFDPSALVSGDNFFGYLRNGALRPWLEDAHAQNTAVVEAAAAATGRLAALCDVVYDGVLGPWSLADFLEAARLDSVHYAVLLPPVELCLERVRTRQGHGFNDRAAAESMWWAFHRADVDPSHVISDHHEQPVEIARTLAQRFQDGTLVHS